MIGDAFLGVDVGILLLDVDDGIDIGCRIGTDS